jgi:5-methylcytosine-specific restriction endonuclease McrA
MPTAPTVDHIIPLARGGSHTWDNVQLAHHLCNSLKGDR